MVPVRLTPAGAKQPGFTAGEPREFNLTVGCCASAVERTVGYLPGGTIAPPPGRDPPPAQPPR
ncbi:MAG TPA: hypothetical protein PLD37_12410, partial [Usitatibacteraceae bacterium]|nr:hypothetical protein [Usitatibacteraceae bacterium]